MTKRKDRIKKCLKNVLAKQAAERLVYTSFTLIWDESLEPGIKNALPKQQILQYFCMLSVGLSKQFLGQKYVGPQKKSLFMHLRHG